MRLPRLLCLMSLFVLASTASWASSPSLTGLSPVGGRRGTDVVVTLSGARLGDAKEILFYQPGITVEKVEAKNDSQVQATLRIAPDCRLGLHDLRLRTATGISELRMFTVGALPDVAEVEPNNDFAKPQPIAMNSTVTGIADNEDVDYFVVEAKKGERITAEVEGIRLGMAFFDPYVAIMNSKRFELASSDDAALVWQDGEASIVAPEDGRYIIQIRESAYAGNRQCTYRLHIGNFPRPTATIPSGGKPGESVEVQWIGDVAGPRKSRVKLPSTPDPDFGIVAEDEKGTAPYPNMFRVSPLGNVIEAEPNDDRATATPFTAPAALNGAIGKAGDVDYFAFKAAKGARYEIKVYARALRSPLDAFLYIGTRAGGTIASNDDAGEPDSLIRFSAPADGEYVVWLHDQLQKGGPEYTYRIEVSPIEPRLTMSVPNESLRRNTGTIAAAVPRGNRQAILVNASRAEFTGPLSVTAAGLPKGVTFEVDPVMAASVATFPMLLTAASDAPVAGTLATVTGKPVDTKEAVTSRFAHTVELVLGQNNVPVWTRTVDAVAVAVTEEAPYSIAIAEPKVPIVRGGSMQLKVVATRKPGFTAPIAVLLPWNPPGIGSAGNISIPENKTEALIPINAGTSAELRTWQIVVNGSSSGPSGPVMVSSQLAKLTVAQPFVSFAYQAATVEQGKEVDLPVKVTKGADFDGEATATLLGLPNKATAEPLKITKDTTELVFHVKTDKTSPAGKHPNLFCQVVITRDGEPIVHNLGTGQLRVDVPIAPKPNAAPARPATAAATAKKPDAQASRPLSRLEQLRQDAKAKAAAGK